MVGTMENMLLKFFPKQWNGSGRIGRLLFPLEMEARNYKRFFFRVRVGNWSAKATHSPKARLPMQRGNFFNDVGKGKTYRITPEGTAVEWLADSKKVMARILHQMDV